MYRQHPVTCSLRLASHVRLWLYNVYLALLMEQKWVLSSKKVFPMGRIECMGCLGDMFQRIQIFVEEIVHLVDEAI